MTHQYTFDEILDIIRAQNRPDNPADETGTVLGFQNQAARYKYGQRPCMLLYRVSNETGFAIMRQWFDADGDPVDFETFRSLTDWLK